MIRDYNLFHILDAQHVPPEELIDQIPAFHFEPVNTVFVVMGNDETAATEAWKTMVAESVPNVYLLEGGVNGWLDQFADDELKSLRYDSEDDELGHAFNLALGARYSAAEPVLDEVELEYTPKVQLESKRSASGGGCG